MPIEFGSKTFDDNQIRWTPAERELFAVIWAVKRWHHYLACAHFEVWTDHKNLINLFALSGKNVNSRVWRWATYLSDYDFTASYLPGRKNIIADFLSRNGATLTLYIYFGKFGATQTFSKKHTQKKCTYITLF